MNLDERARRATEDMQLAVDEADRETLNGPLERFDRFRDRIQRNRRLAAGAVVAVLALVAVALAARAMHPDQRSPATPPLPSGTILFGVWHERGQLATWYTIGVDGAGLKDLGIDASCANWFPDGNRILITNDALRPDAPLRPAVIDPDGTNLRPLDATADPKLHLGCGQASSDGSRLVVEGFYPPDRSHDGIYSMRASDGGDLVRLTYGHDGYPHYSPDASQVVFMRTRTGVEPDGAGAIFVVNADGTHERRITPWGSAFLDQVWSPDGAWIVFQRPYGELWLVHPDGSDLHQVPMTLPAGAGARQPSWSPDGQWIVFTLAEDGGFSLYAVRPDGTGLQPLADVSGLDEAQPSWRP
jgi:dipeptidyl aminopeptidase/acylaminoacyl peptidase